MQAGAADANHDTTYHQMSKHCSSRPFTDLRDRMYTEVRKYKIDPERPLPKANRSGPACKHLLVHVGFQQITCTAGHYLMTLDSKLPVLDIT
jgi:hypothetical protein